MGIDFACKGGLIVVVADLGIGIMVAFYDLDKY